MRKLILTVCFIGLLSACSQNYRMENVNEAFPDSEVAFTPRHDTDFLVRKPDGSIWYVRCDNPVSGKITSKSMIFAKKEITRERLCDQKK